MIVLAQLGFELASYNVEVPYVIHNIGKLLHIRLLENMIESDREGVRVRDLFERFEVEKEMIS